MIFSLVVFDHGNYEIRPKDNSSLSLLELLLILGWSGKGRKAKSLKLWDLQIPYIYGIYIHILNRYIYIYGSVN